MPALQLDLRVLSGIAILFSLRAILCYNPKFRAHSPPEIFEERRSARRSGFEEDGKGRRVAEDTPVLQLDFRVVRDVIIICLIYVILCHRFRILCSHFRKIFEDGI